MLRRALRFGSILGTVLTASALFAATLPAPKPGAGNTNYDKIVNEIKKIQALAPQKVMIFSLGKNNQGTDILGMRISENPKRIAKDKIGMLVVGTHHGNEGASALVATDFAKKLIEKHFITPRDVKDYEFYIVPVLNIPGFNANVRQENGIDPNRDYPGPCLSKDRSYKLKSTKAISDLFEKRDFSATVTLHGFVGSITYPWGVNANIDKTKDHPYFQGLANIAAKANGYRVGTSTAVVYPCDGAFEDYTYWKKGAWSMLYEIKDSSAQDRAKNVDSMLDFFTAVKSSASNDFKFEGQCGYRSIFANMRNE